jgi:hypothetical protein
VAARGLAFTNVSHYLGGTASGYGRLEVVDSPLYSQSRATFDARLKTSDQRSLLGPPSGASEGWNLCSR